MGGGGGGGGEGEGEEPCLLQKRRKLSVHLTSLRREGDFVLWAV